MGLYSYLRGFIDRLQENRMKRKLGSCGIMNYFLKPDIVSDLSHIHLADYTLVQPKCRFIIFSGNVYINKYTSIAPGCTFVTGNHQPCVGIPQRAVGQLHINDVEGDIVVDTDCWIAANVTILCGAHIGRGAIVGANTLIRSYANIPPYAVVVGMPGEIVGVKFDIDDIIEHESHLYAEDQRMSRSKLESLFDTYYKNVKVMKHEVVSEADKEKAREYLKNAPEYNI